MNVFSYSGPPPKYKLYGKGERKILIFPSWINTPYEENNNVVVDIWEPKSFSSAVILLHSWGEGRGGYSELMGKTLYEEGFLSLRLHLPYHIARTPSGHSSGALFLTLDLESSLTSFRQAVVDARTLIDFIISHYSVSVIGGVGISLGAIILLTLIGVEERMECGVSILGGGNLTDIVAKGVATLPLMLAGVRKGLRWRHYLQVRKDFEKFLKEIEEKGMEKVEAPWLWFWFDPLTYAKPGKKVLFINALFDLVIPLPCVLRVRRKMGNPPIVWLPCSHFTSFLFYPVIIRKTLEFLKVNLKKNGE
ncbi:hypothetical protein J7K56_02990 [Candidatus Calescamantes bacterium]|nr:hypothetical protein [Candidatus Calescamantes bacterium]